MISVHQAKGFPDLPSDWSQEGLTIQSPSAALDLYVRRFQREGKKCERILWVIHGMGEHSGRYLHLPYFLQGVVDQVLVADLSGHGKSGGKRGYLKSWQGWVEDLQAIYENFLQPLQVENGAKVAALGHSMGGLLLLSYLEAQKGRSKANRLDGAIFSAPALEIRVKVPFWKELPSRLLEKTLGHIAVHNGLRAEWISHDPNVVRAYLEDPFVHSDITPRLYMEMQRAARARPLTLELPAYFIVPMDDPIIDSQASLDYVQRLTAPHKEVLALNGFYHEPLNEFGKEQAFRAIEGWLRKLGY